VVLELGEVTHITGLNSLVECHGLVEARKGD
jgi:hypothetical protein